MITPKIENGRVSGENHFPSSPEKSDLNIVFSYLSFVRSFPTLSKEQERFLFKSMKLGQTLEEVRPGLSEVTPDMSTFDEVLPLSKDIRDVLINCNLKMVFPVARKHYGLTLMDRVQEGNIGLIKAVDAYDPESESSFYNFAINHIRGAVISSRHDNKLISFPERVERAVDKAWAIFDIYFQEKQTPPTRKEWAILISKETGLSIKQAEEAIGSVLLGRDKPISIDANPHQSSNPGELKLEDTIEDTSSNFTANSDSRLDAETVSAQILASLTPQELEIVRQKYGFYGLENIMQDEHIAAKMNRSRRRVLQIQKGAFDRVRKDKDLQRLARVI